MCYLQTWPSHLMPSLADLGGRWTMPPPHQVAKTPGCNIAMCVSILSAFGVSAQFGPSKLTV